MAGAGKLKEHPDVSDAPPGDLPVVSVIIPVRDDLDGLRRCLEAVEGQTYPRSRYEIIVVDNGSKEPLRDRLGGSAVVVIEEETPGSYVARNRGIDHSKGDLLAFTDADCVPVEKWLEEGVREWRASGGALIAGDVRLTTRDRMSSVEVYEKLFAFRQERYVREEKFGVTANLFVGRSVFERAGRFDPSLRSGGDFEFCQRASANGFGIVFSPEAVVCHPARKTVKELVVKTVRVDTGNLRLGRVDRKGRWRMLVPARTKLKAIWRNPELSTKDKIRASAAATVVSWSRAWVRLFR